MLYLYSDAHRQPFLTSVKSKTNRQQKQALFVDCSVSREASRGLKEKPVRFYSPGSDIQIQEACLGLSSVILTYFL